MHILSILAYLKFLYMNLIKSQLLFFSPMAQSYVNFCIDRILENHEINNHLHNISTKYQD